jgi:hypothetical protein
MELRANDWLNHCASGQHAQRGEDGIIATILDVLGCANDNWCVEFGAWDGIHGSNSYQFIHERNFKAVLIEGDGDRYAALKENMANFPVTTLNQNVAFEGPDRLDAILATTDIPRDFALLSIDIDGNDYHVWESLQNYHPRWW